jgi:hypothetical protein
MELENKNQKEIQQEIFAEIKKGTNIEKLKAELKEKGLHPEGYYFIAESEHTKIMAEPKIGAGHTTGWQIFVAIIAIIVMVIKIARCSNRM